MGALTTQAGADPRESTELTHERFQAQAPVVGPYIVHHDLDNLTAEDLETLRDLFWREEER